jgi:hypothetical protein
MLSFLLRSALGAAFLGAICTAALPVAADELAAIDPRAVVGPAGWRVDGVTGEAMAQRAGAAPRRLEVGQIVSVGSEVRTGADGVVFLSRDGDRLVIQPGSQMRIAEPDPDGLLDHFIQSLGRVFYDVEPRRNRSFGVTAPYVAAVVKGTKFLVTVEPSRNSVRVDEGLVLVSSDGGGSSILVGAGQIAVVEPLWRGIRVTDSGIGVGTGDTAGDESAGGTGGGLGDTLGDAIGGTTARLGDAVAGTTGALGDAVGGAAGAVGNAVGGVGGAVGNAVGGSAGGTVAGAAGAAGGAVGGLGGAVGDAVGGFGGAVGGVVEGVGGTLGGLLGGKD